MTFKFIVTVLYLVGVVTFLIGPFACIVSSLRLAKINEQDAETCLELGNPVYFRN